MALEERYFIKKEETADKIKWLEDTLDLLKKDEKANFQDGLLVVSSLNTAVAH